MSGKPSKPGSGKMMDASAREEKNPVPAVNNQRSAYALTTLVEEVRTLFPETPFEVSNYDGRSVGLDVTFDLTTLAGVDAADLTSLLSLYDLDADPRIVEVIAEHDQVLVSFRSNPRTQDSREPFGLVEAYSVLSGEESS